MAGTTRYNDMGIVAFTMLSGVVITTLDSNHCSPLSAQTSQNEIKSERLGREAFHVGDFDH